MQPSFVTQPRTYSLAAPPHPQPTGNAGVIGHSFDAWASPNTPMDTNGRYIEAPKEFTFKAPLLLHIDSSERDTVAYPGEAFFRMQLPFPLRQVISIEVLNVQFANASAVPPGRYTFLLNGLWDGSRFVAQGNANLGIYKAIGDNTVANYAFAKMPYHTAATTDQCWRKSELRQIKYFNPPEAQIRYLELMLADRDGNPLVFSGSVSDHSWTVTLEVVCKN